MNEYTGKAKAPGGIWTHDLRIRSPTLYPLSYGRIIRVPTGYMSLLFIVKGLSLH